MQKMKKVLNTLLYWLLTLTYGVIALAYTFLHIVRNRSSGRLESSKSREAQPSCLSDPHLGRHRYFKREGTKLHYVEAGNPSHPLVILIHGSPGFWFCWRKQISALAQYSWVIAIDIRGCGDSDTHWYRSKYKPYEIIDDIRFLIRVLDRPSATIVCNEISSQIGWLMAHKFPHLISKLVVINGPHPQVLRTVFHSGWKSYLRHRYLMFLQIPFLPELLINYKLDALFNQFISPLQKFDAISSSEIEAYKYTFSRKEDWIGSLHLLRQFDINPIVAPLQPFSIKCDTLLLMSSSHTYFTTESAYRSAEYAERIKIRIIEGGGGNVQLTHYSAVNRELDSFLERPQDVTPLTPVKSSLVNRVFGAVKTQYSFLPASDYIFEKLGAQPVITSTIHM